MDLKLARFLVMAALCIGLSGAAQASFHLWRITELYSNADGTVQFIEFRATAGGQQYLSGHTITSARGGETRSYTFPTDLPGDSAMYMGGGGYYGGGETTYKSFLIGTQGFAALNVVPPDYVVPNGFLFTASATVNFAGADIVTYTSLPTAGGMSIDRNGMTAMNSPTNFADQMGSIVATAAALDYSDMWWAGQAENGWGLSIQQHGNVQFNALYVYDAAGKPVWYVMPGGSWDAEFTRYTGPIYQPASAPLSAYTPSQFVVGASPGTITLTFTGTSSATLQYSIGGVSGQKTLTRQAFGGGTSPLVVGDMWWGGAAQDGWGVNLVQHGGIVFGVWYTYGPDGKAAWYVLPSGTWSGNTYSGTFYATTGSPWAGASYDPNALVVTPAGTLSFAFTGTGNATMSYTFTSGPFAGTTQSKALVRQPF